jgi:hypothetical protein
MALAEPLDSRKRRTAQHLELNTGALRSPFGLTGAEWLVCLVFAAFSFALFATDAIDAAIHDRVFIGAGASTPDDTLQYLAWATDAAHHGLIANLYGFHNGGHVFLHPIWLLTGLLHVDAGVSYSLLLAVWQAVTLVLLVFAIRRLAQAFFHDDQTKCGLVLVLALFVVSPLFAIGVNLGLSVPWGNSIWLLTGESFGVEWVSGYFPIGLTVVAMIGFILIIASLLDSRRAEPWYLSRLWTDQKAWLAGGLGAVASWLHPWQGTELLLIIFGIAVWTWRDWRRNSRLLIPALLTLAPLVYYKILPVIDVGWKVSNQNSSGGWANPPVLSVLPVFGPLFLAMLPGYRAPVRNSLDLLIRLWPLAVGAAFILTPTAKFHTFSGLTVPAAVLLVQGWPRFRSGWVRCGGRQSWIHVIPWLVVALLIYGSGAALENLLATSSQGSRGDAQIERASANALGYVARQPTGGVLTTTRIGVWVPALTDDPTWVGHFVWTPDVVTRTIDVQWLFGYTGSTVTPSSARRFVRRTGARYVVQPCGSRTDLSAALGSAGWTDHTFGCATVYTAPT